MDLWTARLVAQGLDYEETFVHFESIRYLVAFAAQNKLKLDQMDVSTAFLHGELTEEVYMKQPQGFIKDSEEHLVCRLNRSIYGLNEAKSKVLEP